MPFIFYHGLIEDSAESLAGACGDTLPGAREAAAMQGARSATRRRGGGANERWLRLRSQRRLRERVEQLDRRAGDTEDLTTATAQCDPGFERRDALGLKPIEERLGQIIWQSMRHALRFCRFAPFAKQNLTLM